MFDPVTRALSGVTRLTDLSYPREARIVETAGGEIDVFWYEGFFSGGIFWARKMSSGWSAPQLLVSVTLSSWDDPMLASGSDVIPLVVGRETGRYVFDVTSTPDGTLILAWIDCTANSFGEGPMAVMEMRYQGSWSTPIEIEPRSSTWAGGWLSLMSDPTGTIYLAYSLAMNVSYFGDPGTTSTLFYRT